MSIRTSDPLLKYPFFTDFIATEAGDEMLSARADDAGGAAEELHHALQTVLLSYPYINETRAHGKWGRRFMDKLEQDVLPTLAEKSLEERMDWWLGGFAAEQNPVIAHADIFAQAFEMFTDFWYKQELADRLAADTEELGRRAADYEGNAESDALDGVLVDRLTEGTLRHHFYSRVMAPVWKNFNALNQINAGLANDGLFHGGLKAAFSDEEYIGDVFSYVADYASYNHENGRDTFPYSQNKNNTDPTTRRLAWTPLLAIYARKQSFLIDGASGLAKVSHPLLGWSGDCMDAFALMRCYLPWDLPRRLSANRAAWVAGLTASQIKPDNEAAKDTFGALALQFLVEPSHGDPTDPDRLRHYVLGLSPYTYADGTIITDKNLLWRRNMNVTFNKHTQSSRYAFDMFDGNLSNSNVGTDVVAGAMRADLVIERHYCRSVKPFVRPAQIMDDTVFVDTQKIALNLYGTKQSLSDAVRISLERLYTFLSPFAPSHAVYAANAEQGAAHTDGKESKSKNSGPKRRLMLDIVETLVHSSKKRQTRSYPNYLTPTSDRNYLSCALQGLAAYADSEPTAAAALKLVDSISRTPNIIIDDKVLRRFLWPRGLKMAQDHPDKLDDYLAAYTSYVSNHQHDIGKHKGGVTLDELAETFDRLFWQSEREAALTDENEHSGVTF